MTEAPTEVRLRRAERALEVAWPDGARHRLPAEYLRVESPSAEVQGHAPDQKRTVAGRRHVGIMRLEPVGNYALRILFDDLHDTGIYSWALLRQLGEEQEDRWRAYEAALAAEGLSRDPPARRPAGSAVNLPRSSCAGHEAVASKHHDPT
ncbi:gamma-butyrobetaine hydroxylase-like domain-containing protein [Roseomonas elaeocarpi]|uniref:Gamma-butyrobetaine hydroxylase-like domain-containing protein n=1 Tax=Roseomonas elaeocarpi TaxID=907779 RepID=A0ABV6JXW2_9PROT